MRPPLPHPGMTAEFERRLAVHPGIVLKVAASYARDPDDRAELAQEIRLQLWRAWPTYEAGRAFATWMYRIALNVAISHRRRESRRPRPDPLDDSHQTLVGDRDAGVGAEARQHLALVQQAMRALGTLDRALLLLHLEGCSHGEAGEVLGISESNVATRLGRIRKQLRRDAGEPGGTDGND